MRSFQIVKGLKSGFLARAYSEKLQLYQRKLSSFSNHDTDVGLE